MKRNTRTQPPERSSNGNHLMIDVNEDGLVQVVTHCIGTGSSSEKTSELITNIINAPPLHPALFDGTFRYDGESVDSESEWSLSMATETSQESESEMNLEEVDSRPVFSIPVIEPSSDWRESKRQSISVVSKVQGHAVGAVIDSESTVLMQLSRENVGGHNKLMDDMMEVNDMLNSQNSVVILKYPSLEDSQGSRRIQESYKETAKQMMELTEDVLRKVQGSTRESILVKLQRALGEILSQPEDTIVVHTFSKEGTEKTTSEAFVGYFSTEDESVILVQAPKSNEKNTENISVSEDEEQISVDRLRSFLQECLQGQDDIMEETFDTEPEITINKSGDFVVGVLSFPNASTAVMKTTVQNFPLEQDHAEMVQSMKNLYRNLVQESSEKLLIQTHSDGDRDSKLEQIKTDLDESMKSGDLESHASGISVRQSDDKVIGVLNYSGGSIVIQTSSKNWFKVHSSANPKDLLNSIRLLIEQFITNNELNDVDLRSLATIIVQVFHSSRVDLPEEFINKHVLQKISFVVHQLMNPSDREDPLSVINQIREIVEDIPKAEIKETRPEDFDYLELLKSYFDELICEENTQFDNDSIIRTLREAILNVLIHYEASLSSALEELLELLKTIPAESIELHSPLRVTSCPGTTDITDEHLHLQRLPSDSASLEVVQHIHNLLSVEEPPGGREVSYISLFQTLFLSLVKIIGGWSFRVKSFLGKEPRQAFLAEPEPDLEPTPEPSSSLTRKPSVSFHLIQSAESNEETPSDISQQLEEECQTLNNTIDELRHFLEKSLNVPDKWDQDRKGSRMEFLEGSPGIKNRMLHLFSQLLDEAGKLKVTDKSNDSIHLRLDSASGELERKEGEQYVVLNGNVRDHKHNLGLFFEARMIDLRYASKLESEVECVKEVRRLSDESDEFDLGNLVPEMVESCMAEVGSDLGDAAAAIQTSGDEFRMQENLSRYFDLIQNYIQESMEPMRETLEVILERLTMDGTEKIREIQSSFIHTSRNLADDYIVEMVEDDCQEELALGDDEEEAESTKCVAAVGNQTVQTNEDLKDETTRLDSIEHELRDLKQQLKNLCAILRPPPAIERSQSASTESSQTKSLLTIVEPSALTLEEIEARLSVTVEIVPDTEERNQSELSDVSDVRKEFFSAMQCPDEVVPESDEKPSTIDSIRGSHDEDTQAVTLEKHLSLTTDVERSSEEVIEQPRFDDYRRSTVDPTEIDDRQDRRVLSFEEAVIEQSQRRSTVDLAEIADEVEMESEASRTSLKKQLSLTRSSETVLGQTANGNQGDPISSIEENVSCKDSLDDRSSLTMERARPSKAVTDELQLDEKCKLTIGSTVTANDQRDSRVLSFVVPTESIETLQPSTISQGRERISSLNQTNTLKSMQEVNQSRKLSITSTRGSTTSKYITEEQSIPPRKSNLELDEICDLMLSYQCPLTDEIGRKFICPAEIYSCHPVGPNQLMVHWEVAPQFLKQISGYKVYVDGEARSVCYSRRRRTALIEDINLRNQHRIAIYCTPEASARELVQWAPGIFFYHL
ncbi:uncharacterized protein LOC135703033 [Ochlerotatus camptorhynchus]|uniref:uncharacterized protein LOC135703033 n=1 Tax=Ochlerotatus camptorhynchus TaxID=644619 RepID=UPI0031E29CF8